MAADHAFTPTGHRGVIVCAQCGRQTSRHDDEMTVGPKAVSRSQARRNLIQNGTPPAGWTQHGDHTGIYYRRIVAGAGHVDVAPEGVYVVPFGERIEDPERAFEFGRSLSEAAEMFAQLKAGA